MADWSIVDTYTVENTTAEAWSTGNLCRLTSTLSMFCFSPGTNGSPRTEVVLFKRVGDTIQLVQHTTNSGFPSGLNFSGGRARNITATGNPDNDHVEAVIVSSSAQRYRVAILHSITDSGFSVGSAVFDSGVFSENTHGIVTVGLRRATGTGAGGVGELGAVIPFYMQDDGAGNVYTQGRALHYSNSYSSFTDRGTLTDTHPANSVEWGHSAGVLVSNASTGHFALASSYGTLASPDTVTETVRLCSWAPGSTAPSFVGSADSMVNAYEVDSVLGQLGERMACGATGGVAPLACFTNLSFIDQVPMSTFNYNGSSVVWDEYLLLDPDGANFLSVWGIEPRLIDNAAYILAQENVGPPANIHVVDQGSGADALTILNEGSFKAQTITFLDSQYALYAASNGGGAGSDFLVYLIKRTGDAVASAGGWSAMWG